VFASAGRGGQTELSARFAIALYPGHLWISEGKFELNRDIRVTANAPPTFLVQAEDDNVDNVNNSRMYCVALKTWDFR